MDGTLVGLLLALAAPPSGTGADAVVLGPVGVTRGAEPRTEAVFTFAADPATDYTLSLQPDGTPGLRATVSLDGRVVIRPERFGGRAAAVAETLPLRRTNRLTLSVTGPSGGAVTLAVRASRGGLPPDPGPAAGATLEGIDADGDGLRDDLQRDIADRHPESRRLRLALTSYARAMQDALLDAERGPESIDHARRLSLLVDCLHGLRGYRARDLYRHTAERAVDTPARSRAYAAFRAQIEGEVFVVTPIRRWKSACPFDPDQVAD